MRRLPPGEFLRIVRFLAVGGLNTLFSYACYAAFVLAGAPAWLAVGGATCLAFFFNFFSYGGLVFGTVSRRLLPRFLAFYVVLGGANVVLLKAMAHLNVGPLLSQAMLLPILAGLSYIGLQRLVFRGDTLAGP